LYAGGVNSRTLVLSAILVAGSWAAGGSGASQVQPFELDEATIAQLQQHMRDGRYTAAQLVDFYSRRIASIDRSGPALRSVIEMNPDAASIAASLDAERRPAASAGPLHGIPVVIKDNIDTATA
jgi:amidase